MAFVKIRQRLAPGKLVPGADQLAVITAVDTVAQQRPQFQRDRAIVLDRQVGNAAARIEPVRRDDGLGRADVDAGAALAAVAGFRLGQRQRQIDIDFAEEEHGAGLAVQRQRVLAAPALAAAAGQLDLEHRGGIGKHAVAERSEYARHGIGQLLQALTQHLVVITATGVERYHRFAGLLQPGQFMLAPVFRRRAGQIIHARRDHAHRARHQLGRARALQAMAFHVVHAAVKALLEPGQQPRLGAGQVDIGHAQSGKAERGRLLLQDRP